LDSLEKAASILASCRYRHTLRWLNREEQNDGLGKEKQCRDLL
jgi:hypothetical protein